MIKTAADGGGAITAYSQSLVRSFGYKTMRNLVFDEMTAACLPLPAADPYLIRRRPSVARWLCFTIPMWSFVDFEILVLCLLNCVYTVITFTYGGQMAAIHTQILTKPVAPDKPYPA